LLKDLNGRLVCPVKKKLASPHEQVVLARVHARGGLKFVRRLYELSVLLIDLAQQVVKLSGISLLGDFVNKLACLVLPTREEIGERQVVAIVVGRRIDLLRSFEEGERLCDLSGLEIELGQVVVCLEIIRL
jgi:hypothetical protein